MKALLACASVLLSASLALAQGAASQTHTSNLGFSYDVPAGWSVMDMQPAMPALKQQQAEKSSNELEKKGIECSQIDLMARHTDPMAVVLIVTLPYECFGQTMTDAELPGFASGAAEGLKQSLDVSEPVYSAYKLGTHSMWIERAKGTPKGQAGTAFTVEITCSLLKKTAACWMVLAGDDASLKAFEHGAVSLDGDAAAELVPATAFDKKS